MISYLIGKIHEKSKDSVTVLTIGGVGYAVRMPAFRITELLKDAEVTLHIYTRVTENAIDLFGFQSVSERFFFELLLTVKGVGPKSAMNILALGSIDQIKDAIARGDAVYLSSVQGMGKKTAERLCVELKGKIKDQGPKIKDQRGSTVMAEVIDGLVALGYAKQEAKEKVQALDTAGKTTEQLLKEALIQ